jgi:hypothetical protein
MQMQDSHGGRVMADVHLPDDLEKMPVVAVLSGSPAHEWFMRMCQAHPLRPGQIISASEEEMESLRNDVIAVTVMAS